MTVIIYIALFPGHIADKGNIYCWSGQVMCHYTCLKDTSRKLYCISVDTQTLNHPSIRTKQRYKMWISWASSISATVLLNVSYCFVPVIPKAKILNIELHQIKTAWHYLMLSCSKKSLTSSSLGQDILAEYSLRRLCPTSRRYIVDK